MKVSQQKKPTKTSVPAQRKTTNSRAQLKLVKNDEWLAPYADAIRGRHEQALHKIEELTQGKQSISEFAMGHTISDCIARGRIGFSESGHPMPRASSWSETAMIGRRIPNLSLNASKIPETGS